MTARGYVFDETERPTSTHKTYFLKYFETHGGIDAAGRYDDNSNTNRNNVITDEEQIVSDSDSDDEKTNTRKWVARPSRKTEDMKMHMVYDTDAVGVDPNTIPTPENQQRTAAFMKMTPQQRLEALYRPGHASMTGKMEWGQYLMQKWYYTATTKRGKVEELMDLRKLAKAANIILSNPGYISSPDAYSLQQYVVDAGIAKLSSTLLLPTGDDEKKRLLLQYVSSMEQNPARFGSMWTETDNALNEFVINGVRVTLGRMPSNNNNSTSNNNNVVDIDDSDNGDSQ